MSNTRAERIHRSTFARKRRHANKSMRMLVTLREWARQHRLRLKRNKSSH